MKEVLGIIIIFCAISHFIFATIGQESDMKFKHAIYFDLFIIAICMGSYLVVGV